MKKLTILSIAVVALSLASCKKDYTCTCTTSGSSTASVTKILDVNKKQAQANCVSGTTTAGSYSGSQTCTLAK